MNSTDASLQLRLSELQDALGRRDERIQQLQLERQRLQGKQTELAQQVLALQTRESQLDRQLRALGSPGPQHGHGLQVGWLLHRRAAEPVPGDAGVCF